MCSAWASVETVSVLASPGTPIVRQCPRAKMQISICSIISSWPMMTLWTSPTSASRAWATRRTASSGVIWGVFADMPVPPTCCFHPREYPYTLVDGGEYINGITLTDANRKNYSLFGSPRLLRPSY